jgi:hypothetical protein
VGDIVTLGAGEVNKLAVPYICSAVDPETGVPQLEPLPVEV